MYCTRCKRTSHNKVGRNGQTCYAKTTLQGKKLSSKRVYKKSSKKKYSKKRTFKKASKKRTFKKKKSKVVWSTKSQLSY